MKWWARMCPSVLLLVTSTTDAGGDLETSISGTGAMTPPLKAWLTAKAFLFLIDKLGVCWSQCRKVHVLLHFTDCWPLLQPRYTISVEGMALYSCFTSHWNWISRLFNTVAWVRGGGDLVILICISLLTEAAQPLIVSLLIIHIPIFIRGCFIIVCMWGGITCLHLKA